MTTTYVRLKNRRGNRQNLPQPLAEGEIGLATDTRELFIGTGSQDQKNRMVQLDSIVNAEVQAQSFIDTRLVIFHISGTQSFLGDGTNASSTVLNGGTALTLPSGKGTPVNPDHITVTKFDGSNNPTVIPSSDYTVSVAGSDLTVTFVSTAIPESGAKVVVTPWTASEIVTAVAGSGLGIETDQSLANNALHIDLTTGTGFADIGSSGNQATASTTLAGLDPISSANTNANLQIRGRISQLGYSANKLEVPGTLLVETDSPQQAIILSTFLNQTFSGTPASVASNIKIFTQDSRPTFEANQFVGDTGLLKATLTGNTTSPATVFTYDKTKENTIIIEYSLKIASSNAMAVGTIKIITDGTNSEIMDDRLETNDTSAVVFSTPNPGAGSNDFKLEYKNTGSNNASMSYLLKRWLTS